jgi:hypothetical protein
VIGTSFAMTFYFAYFDNKMDVGPNPTFEPIFFPPKPRISMLLFL